MNNFSNFLKPLGNSEVDEFSFSGNFKVQYNFEVKHNIFIGIEYININAALFNDFASFNYIFEAIPIMLGYEYMFKSKGRNWTPYLGIGISYVIEKMEDKFSGDFGAGVVNDEKNTFGFEVKIGVERNLLEYLFWISELKYRNIGDTNLTNTVDINLSGVSFLLGIKLEL